MVSLDPFALQVKKQKENEGNLSKLCDSQTTQEAELQLPSPSALSLRDTPVVSIFPGQQSHRKEACPVLRATALPSLPRVGSLPYSYENPGQEHQLISPVWQAAKEAGSPPVLTSCGEVGEIAV